MCMCLKFQDERACWVREEDMTSAFPTAVDAEEAGEADVSQL